MKVSHRIHLLAAVLVVVFLLTTVWAGYYLYSETHPTATPGLPSVASYQESGANSFVAALRPSTLYNNSTEIAGGNITLFSPITTWINVSMYYSVLVNRSAAISVDESFEVVMANAVWSKTLFAASNLTNVAAGRLATVVTRYAVNVSYVTALAAEINSQVGYPGTQFTLELRPAMNGDLTVDGAQQRFGSDPLLNLTFTGPLIEPKGLSFSGNGSVVSTTPAAPAKVGAAPYALLVVSVGALGGSGWLATRPRDGREIPLEELIAPYEELIAETAATPKGEVTVPVAQFPDLVKIADTLGKPILRPAGAEPERPAFIVLDGTIAYAYWHALERTPYAGPRGAIPIVPIGAATDVARIGRLQGEADRLRGLSLDPRTDREARRRIRRAIDLIHAHDDRGADREIDDLSRLLDRAELRPGASTGRPKSDN